MGSSETATVNILQDIAIAVILRSAGGCGPDLPLASAGSDMIRWGRVLLGHTLDAARSY